MRRLAGLPLRMAACECMRMATTDGVVEGGSSSNRWDPVGDESRRWQRLPTAGAVELGSVCLQELQAEVERDEGEGMASVPPLIPEGWRSVHQPGTSYFVMHRDVQFTSGVAPLPKFNQSSPAALQHNPTPLRREPLAVSIYAPFRVTDPSLSDTAVDICEWQPFTVRALQASSSRALFMELASANSQLRILRMQMIGVDASRLSGFEASELDELIPFNDPLLGWSLEAQHNRRLRYYGPAVGDLAKPMRLELAQYIDGVLGVDPRVMEFVCQMQYHYEHQEYLRWLERLSRSSKKTEAGPAER